MEPRVVTETQHAHSRCATDYVSVGLAKRVTNYGKVFEARIEYDATLRRVTVVRIPDEVRGLYGSKKVQVHTPFDFAAGILGRAAFFDAKATGKPTFNLKDCTQRKTEHQWLALQEAAAQGNKAGYLIWFYSSATIAWAGVEQVQGYLRDGLKSINPYLPGLRIQGDNEAIDLERLIFASGTKDSKT
jgi:hypothetical protein